MRLQELMDHRVVTVSANDYAADALYLMRKRGLSKVFVLDRDRITGVVFEKDLRKLSETSLQERDVRETMATNLQVVGPDLESSEAERMLRRGGLVCLVIQDGQRIQGAISPEDLAPLEMEPAGEIGNFVGAVRAGKSNPYHSHPRGRR